MTHSVPLSQAMLLAVGRTLSDQRATGRRITDSSLAAALGTSKNTIGRRLSGQSAITPDEFELFADALGVAVDWLWALARQIQEEAQPTDSPFPPRDFGVVAEDIASLVASMRDPAARAAAGRAIAEFDTRRTDTRRAVHQGGVA